MKEHKYGIISFVLDAMLVVFVFSVSSPDDIIWIHVPNWK